MIKEFDQNKMGKDYICADIHGYFDLLELELTSVGFDPDVDRLFCTGDLIDRGEGSFRAQEWLEKPWFNSILGNHESMYMEMYEHRKDEYTIESWNSISGGWITKLSDSELTSLYEAFSLLPVAFEITLNNGKRIGLVHAQLPMSADWLVTKKQLQEPGINHYSNCCQELLWGRKQVYYSQTGRESCIQTVQNIDHVFHGHTIVSEILTLSNRTFMDLGSYQSGQIGFLDPLTFLDNLSRP